MHYDEILDDMHDDYIQKAGKCMMTYHKDAQCRWLNTGWYDLREKEKKYAPFCPNRVRPNGWVLLRPEP